MRGSPLLRALIVFAALLALAPAVWRMTNAEVPKPVAVAAEKPGEIPELQVALNFTTMPKRVAIVHLDAEVWAKDDPEADEEFALKLQWPNEGGDLLFKVTWPDDAPLAAMRVRLTDPADNEIERNLWGRGQTEKVLRFP
jgi:hypothetical protein